MNILRLSAAAAVIGAGLLASAPAFAWHYGPGYGYGPPRAYGYEYGPPRPHWRHWRHRHWGRWGGPPPRFYGPRW